MIDAIPKDKKLILFDGVCNLCNNSVLFVIKHDEKNKFLYAPLQSEIGKIVLDQFKIDTTEIDSILLFNPKLNQLKIKSSAALLIAKELNFPINIMSIFLILPNFLRNWIYDIIAKNRYKWFGKKETCMIPTPELQAKFLN